MVGLINGSQLTQHTDSETSSAKRVLNLHTSAEKQL